MGNQCSTYEIGSAAANERGTSARFPVQIIGTHNFPCLEVKKKGGEKK